MNDMEKEMMRLNGVQDSTWEKVDKRAAKLTGIRRELVLLAEKALRVDRWGCAWDSYSVYTEKEFAINGPIEDVEKKVKQMREWFK